MNINCSQNGSIPESNSLRRSVSILPHFKRANLPSILHSAAALNAALQSSRRTPAKPTKWAYPSSAVIETLCRGIQGGKRIRSGMFGAPLPHHDTLESLATGHGVPSSYPFLGRDPVNGPEPDQGICSVNPAGTIMARKSGPRQRKTGHSSPEAQKGRTTFRPAEPFI